MKLLKTLAICFLAFVTIALTGCNNSFCSPEDATRIQDAMQEKFEKNDFSGFSEKAKKQWEVMIEDTKDKPVSEIEAAKDKVVADIYKAEHPKSCLTINETKDPLTGATIEGKSWGYAFSKNGGFLEGLLVYPIAALLISLSNAFKIPGTAQVLAIILGTLIIKVVVLLLTFKSTLASQRLQLLQPELNALQAKYANMDDKNAKNRMAMETMDLYKKYKINPFTSMLSMIVTFPIFISMYGAVQASTTLKEGSIFGVSLGENLGPAILKWNWFAIVLFLLMAITQFLSMKVPTWIANKKAKHHGNPNEKNPLGSTQTIMSYVMLVMIVVIGWMLPISMTIYWVSSSIFAILQSIIMSNINITPKPSKKDKKKSILEQIRG